ncbi:hypothetical protein PUATCC27989T_00427 [Phytobacter ursingii]|nr:hypothetical protein PUATCC27989T_00427 [Phytobacter ursingii]
MTKPTIAQFRDFCKKHAYLKLEYKPIDCGSWRGVYSEPCIFVERGEGKLSEFIPFLDRLVSGEEFFGYKGGEYTYCDRDDINIENDKSCYYGDDSMFFDVIKTIKTLHDPLGLIDMLIEAA